MRLQLDLAPIDLGTGGRLTAVEAAALAKRVQELLVSAGFEVTVGEDQADVGNDNPDWALLSPEEQATGGFTYPELVIAGPARVEVAVFLRSVFVGTDPDFDAEQAATAQVVRVLRTISPLVVITVEAWRDIERTAADRYVAADGSILRPILSWSELSARAVALFDEARSPEFARTGQERYAAQLATLGDHTTDLPPFRASVAADPSGSSFGYQLPWKPPFTSAGLKPLRKAMKAIVDAALDDADDLTGVPTGLVVDHDENGTTATLVFDNLVDSGAMNPALRTEDHRTAPFAWENITARAARRDPAFQPTWAVDAVELLAAGGTDVDLNTSSTLAHQGPTTNNPTDDAAPSPTPLPEPPPDRGLRDRVRRWFGA